jgi:hypothetical protein
MFSKQTILVTLLESLTLFFLGWIFYGMVTVEFFRTNTLVDIPKRMDMSVIALGCFIEAFVLANLFCSWTNHENSVFEGFQFGAWIGLFLGFGSGFVSYGTFEMHTLNVHLVDAAWSIFFHG